MRAAQRGVAADAVRGAGGSAALGGNIRRRCCPLTTALLNRGVRWHPLAICMTLLTVLRPRGVLACAAALTACRTWRPAGPASAGAAGAAESAGVAGAVAAASGPEGRPVRLLPSRGAAVVLLAPRVERDSVVGTDARLRARRAVALADVRGVEAWRVGAGTTLAGVAAGALLAAAALYAVVAVLVVQGT